MTIKERENHKTMGRKYVAYFRTINGAPFHQGFMNKHNLDDFIAKCNNCGTICIKIIEL